MKERFIIELQAAPGGIPAIVRLRKFLKMALRSYGLKCIAIRESKPTTDKTTEGSNPEPRSHKPHTETAVSSVS